MKKDKIVLGICAIALILTFILWGMAVAQAQTVKRDNFWIKQGASAMGYMAAGFFFREAEILKDDYRRYAAVHPNADPQWANPRYSQYNKYKSRQDNSPKFFGSTTVFVFTTDKFHLNNTIAATCMISAASLNLTLWEKPKWKQIAIQAVVSYISYTSGRALADKVYPKID